MPEATTDLSSIRAIALDDPWGALETLEGAAAIRRAVDRLRRAGYAQAARLLIDPNVGQNRSVRMFQRFWKGVTWVVLASWDGSLAYRVPVDHFHAEDPFKVPHAEICLRAPRRPCVSDCSSSVGRRWACSLTWSTRSSNCPSCRGTRTSPPRARPA